MKKYLLALILLLGFYSHSQAQPIFYENGKYWGVHAGFKHASHNCGDFNIGQLELSTYMNPQLGFEFYIQIEYSKNYFSFSPVGLLGLPMWIYSSSHNMGREANMVAALLSVATARIPFSVCDWFEITPTWNLLKFTKVYGSKLKLNADVGLNLKLYPFCWTDSLSTLYIAGFAQYEWAYKKNAGDFIYNDWGHLIKRTDKSLFFGYSWGVKIGMYF